MKNKKADDTHFYSRAETDEMQRTLSFELEHKSFRMWYVFNSLIMFAVHFIFVSDHISIRAGENAKSPAMSPAMQVIILLFYGAGILSLALYNYRAASMGVLDAFASKYQKGVTDSGELVNGEKRPDNKGRVLAVFNLMVPAWGVGSAYENYLAFFLAWLIIAFAYEVFTIFCVDKNKKAKEKQLADEEIEEE